MTIVMCGKVMTQISFIGVWMLLITYRRLLQTNFSVELHSLGPVTFPRFNFPPFTVIHQFLLYMVDVGDASSKDDEKRLRYTQGT
jgi:hypothetical protein